MAQNSKELISNLSALTEKVNKLKAKMKGLKEGTDKHLASTIKLNKAMEEQNKALKASIAHESKLSAKHKNHIKAKEKLRKEIDKATKAQKASIAQDKKKVSAMSRLTGGMSGRIKTLGKYLLATKLIQLGIQFLSTIFITATNRAIEYDGALGDLGATTGKSGEELKAFSKVAKATAGATKLTAVEVVKLQKSLAKLGTSSEDILKLTLPIAQLSQALGESGDEVAKVFKSISNQFGLTTNASVDLSGTILKSTTSSALNLNSLATGMSYVGTQAGIMGLSVEETSANLAVLADNGLSASKAGTGFRNVLVAAVKSGKGYNEFIDELAEKGLSAGDAQRIFGKRAAAAALVLVRNRQEVLKLTEGLNDNEAVLVATIQQMGSAKGITEQLTSAWGNLLISVGDNIAQSNLYITALKLINRELGEQAELLKDVKEGGEATQNSYLAGARLADGFEGTDIIPIDVQKLEEEALKIAALINPDYYNKLRDNFISQTEKGAKYEGKTFLEFLNLAQVNSGDKLYNKQIDDRKKFVAEFIKQGLVLQQGNADNSAAELEEVIAFTEESERLRKAAQQNKLNPDEVLAYEELVQKEITITEEKLKFDQYVADAANKSFENDPDSERTRRTVINANAILNVTKAKLDILNKESEDVKNLANNQEELNRLAAESFKIKLDQLKRDRLAALEKLELEEAVNKLTVKGRDELLAHELKYAEARGGINRLYGYSLDELIEKNKDATNVEGARNLLQTWEHLGDISVETVNLLGQKMTDMMKDVEDYEKAQDKLFKAGDITKKERFDNITKYQEQQKARLGQFGEQIIKLAKLSGESAEVIRKAIASINFTVTDPKTEGEDLTDFYAEQGKKVAREALSAFKDFGSEKLDNLKSQKENELDVIRERYAIEQNILKSNLDNQLITEGQFRIKSAELKKAQINEENAVNRKMFDQQLKQDRATAVAAGLEAIAQSTIIAFTTGDPASAALRAAISGGVIAASTGAKLAAIGTRKFYPKKFEDGGMVNGPSHAEGGVPFSVQGRGGYEMEGGEFIVNKRSASMHKELLDKINSSGRTSPIAGSKKFALGGLVSGIVSNVNEMTTINILTSIEENTSTSAVNSNKPTKAFVSSKDLDTNSRERSITNKNNRV